MELGFDPGLVLLALAPIFLICIALEAWYWHRRGIVKYSLVDSLSNAGLALMHQGADLLATVLFIKTAYTWTYDHGVQVFPNTWWSVLAAFLIQDFLYYGFHRASHRVRWLWSSHVTHHSSERLNLSTAFRQSLTYPLSGMWAFWLPMAWLGFSPDLVLLVVGLNLGYQFFVHTEAVGKLDWFEKIFNTPSHHRVHHAKNPQYIDRNFAGVLIIWDKLFGSYVEEEAQPVFGIVRQVRSHNPLTLTFHEWAAMFRDVWRDKDPRHLWKPPEWAEKVPEPSAARLPYPATGGRRPPGPA
ncbi:sterol desaturase family protein [Chitinimonas arctica]|uniref:Sterol desaturase family protein n=1 Tax=Chitinimonas arctica TaxID=2594795 RepID=A0A516SEQ3_9NEIS|nr:sterol desaturase family protein [Chitinimonas arctica]QDQ26649.1 sterol desaturase family protein [Chitinimonas arctica]